MLSIDRCRKLIKSEPDLSDDQIRNIRDSLYGLAHVAVSRFLMESKSNDDNKWEQNRFTGFLDTLPQKERDALMERATILQTNGGVHRDEAERAAITEYIESRKN